MVSGLLPSLQGTSSTVTPQSGQAARRVDEGHGDLPERNELVTARREPIVARPLPVATGADGASRPARLDPNFQGQASAVVGPGDGIVGKGLLRSDVVENSREE